MVALSMPSATALGPTSGSYNPNPNTKHTASCNSEGQHYEILLITFYLYYRCYFVLGSVWALPRSLAATKGISFDFSSSAY